MSEPTEATDEEFDMWLTLQNKVIQLEAERDHALATNSTLEKENGRMGAELVVAMSTILHLETDVKSALAGVAEFKKLAADVAERTCDYDYSTSPAYRCKQAILAIPTELADWLVKIEVLEARLKEYKFHHGNSLTGGYCKTIGCHGCGYIENLNTELATARHAADELRGRK